MMKQLMAKYQFLPFVAPFAVFIVMLGLKGILPVDVRWHYPIQVVVVSAVLLSVRRREVFRVPVRPLAGIVIGLAVFAIWVGPDQIWPSYRHHWLFENSLIGDARSSLPSALRSDILFLFFRILGTAILVPIVEELFWRGWLMRYLINPDFLKVPLGN